jgi:hypothetical protein
MLINQLAGASLIGLSLVSVAQADFVGWTSTSREVSGGYLINVFAVVDSSSDVLVNVYGANPAAPMPGRVTTASIGGFLQSTGGSEGLFMPASNQSWTSLDSFLTLGGSYVGGNWIANGSTLGDPNWNSTYDDTTIGESVTVNAMSTNSNDSGFENPWVSGIPLAAGWYGVPGAGGQFSTAHRARALSNLPERIASSSTSAELGTWGMMVAQFYVVERNLQWRMGATVKRGVDGSASAGMYEFSIVPAPAAMSIGVMSCVLGGLRIRRR